jgi:hypothetical protein
MFQLRSPSFRKNAASTQTILVPQFLQKCTAGASELRESRRPSRSRMTASVEAEPVEELTNQC